MNNFFIFKNRAHAGKLLSSRLAEYQNGDIVICAIPRGGVAIGHEISKSLNSPLDIIVTRKIGHPQNREYAICAVDEDQNFVYNPGVIRTVPQTWLMQELENGRDESRRRKLIYRGPRKSECLEDKIVILTDDGVATGLTIELAIKIIKSKNPKKLILALPVAPHDAVQKFRETVDEMIILIEAKKYLGSVGAYYLHFPDISDSEVIELMKDQHVTNKISYRI